MVSWDERTFARCQDVCVCLCAACCCFLMPLLVVHCSICLDFYDFFNGLPGL